MTLAEAMAEALEKYGVDYDAAVVIIRPKDMAHLPNGMGAQCATTGDPQVIAALCYGMLAQMISEPVTVQPHYGGDN